jgi:division protein CdvB (Snf7/Vps24/ESCRT-III family)|tara:strand:- start:12146 stop:12805 length:660 start_codon:yes stop_codon:yes gene_type:complete
MPSFLNKWKDTVKNNEKLTSAFMGKVKPEAPLKNRLEVAQKKLQLQITKLDEIDTKLNQKNNAIFEKIVEAKKSNNETYAKVYANELAEIRKHEKMVNNAKLSMEQIQIRLNTVSELGDVVVTLSPCMSLIKGLSSSLGGMMPTVADSMQDLSNMLGDIVTGSSITHDGSIGQVESTNSDAQSILAEAQSIVEGQARQSMPEPPSTTTIESILQEREQI